MKLHNEPLTPGWHFAGLVAGALMALNRPRNARAVAYVMASQARFDDLSIDYYRHWLATVAPSDWATAVYRIQGDINEAQLVPALRGRSFELTALIRYATETGLSEPLANDLRRMVTLDADELARIAQPTITALQHQDRKARKATDRDGMDGKTVVRFRES